MRVYRYDLRKRATSVLPGFDGESCPHVSGEEKAGLRKNLRSGDGDPPPVFCTHERKSCPVSVMRRMPKTRFAERLRRDRLMFLTHSAGVTSRYDPGSVIVHEGAEWVVTRQRRVVPTTTTRGPQPCWEIYGRPHQE